LKQEKDYEKLYKQLTEFIHSRFSYYKGVLANIKKQFDGTRAKAQLAVDVNSKLDVLSSIVVFIDEVEKR